MYQHEGERKLQGGKLPLNSTKSGEKGSKRAGQKNQEENGQRSKILRVCALKGPGKNLERA
jgi:hypothetical protein